MSRDAIIVIIILIINFIAAVAYILTAILREKRDKAIKNDRLPTKQRCILQGYLMLICPVVAGMYFLCSYLFYKFFGDKNVDYEDISFNKERVKTIVAPDVEKALNVVPIEEALAISDKYSLRRLLMEVLKNNKDDSLGAINMSLSSEDSETSHYAASVLMDTLSQFRKRTAQLQLEFESDCEQFIDSGVELTAFILCFLSYGILSSAEEETYALIAEKTAQSIFDISQTRLSPELLLALCEALLHADKCNEARLWSERICDVFPRSLQRYVAALKVCHKVGDREGFFDTLRLLRVSDIPISHEVLQIIKLFNVTNSK